MIYFIQQGDDGPIKIGRTENLPQRMRELQVGNPELLRLLGVIPEEAELQALFGNLRVRGEWFKPESQILDFIQAYTMTPDKFDLEMMPDEAEHHQVSFTAEPPEPLERFQTLFVSLPAVDTITSARPKDGKDSELTPTRLRIDEFCEVLSIGAVHGLGFRQICGLLQCTGRKISQWYHWVELVHPLVVAGIYNRESGEVHPDFVNGHGLLDPPRLDPIKVLDALGLEKYKNLL